MRKILVLAVTAMFFTTTFSQTTGGKKKFDLGNRAADHFLLQLASNQWSGAPDSVTSHMGSFNRSGNIYLMLDKPFKSNQRFSIAFGLGIGTSSIYFKRMEVAIASTNAKLPFTALDSTNHFKKYKLSTSFLEIPFEFRFSSNPEKPTKSIKLAIGGKVGTMLNAKTKGKTLQNASGNTLNNFTQKTGTKSYFNTTRLGATARAGYGYVSLFGTYYFTPVFKDGVTADIKLYQIGITVSGL